VQFNLREFYELGDIIKTGLNTHSDRGMLETAGMVHLEAFAGGEELELKKPIDLGFTGMVDASADDGFQLFNMTYDERMDPIWVEQTSNGLEENDNAGNQATVKELTGSQLEWGTGDFSSDEKEMDWNYGNAVFTGSKSEGQSHYTTQVYSNELEFEQMLFWQKDIGKIIQDEPACYSGIWVKGLLSRGGGFFPTETSWGDDFPSCDQQVMEGFTQLEPLGPEIRPKKDTTPVTIYINPHLRTAQNSSKDISRDQLKQMLSIDTIDYTTGIGQAGTLGIRSSISNSLFSSTSLGWINCDRFTGYDNNNVNLLVELEEDDESYLVFKESRSVMRPSYLKEAIYFGGIPYGEEAVLVTIRHGEEGSIQMAMQEIMTEPGTIKPSGFIEMDEGNVDNAIAALNF
jgi:hypothetical protein